MYIDIPKGSRGWRPPVANAAALPTSGNSDGDVRVVLDTYKQYVWEAGSSTWAVDPSAVVAWGVITGTLSNQTDLQNALNSKQSTTLTSAHILVGNGSNAATDVAVSGDLTLANTGAFTLAKIQGTTVSGVTGTGNVVFSASPTFTGNLTLANGTAAAPSFHFADTTTGLYRPTTNQIGFSTAGTGRWLINATGSLLTVTDGSPSIGALGANRPNNIFAKTNIYSSVFWFNDQLSDVYSSSAGVVEIDTGSSPGVTFPVMQWSENGGTGETRIMRGGLVFDTDGGGNIGTSGANRPGSLFLKNNISLSGTISGFTTIRTQDGKADINTSSAGVLDIDCGTVAGVTNPMFRVTSSGLVSLMNTSGSNLTWDTNLSGDIGIASHMPNNIRYGGQLILPHSTNPATPDIVWSYSGSDNVGIYSPGLYKIAFCARNEELANFNNVGHMGQLALKDTPNAYTHTFTPSNGQGLDYAIDPGAGAGLRHAFFTNNVLRFTIADANVELNDNVGLKFHLTNTVDIGTDIITKAPRNIFAGTNVAAGGKGLFTGGLGVGNSASATVAVGVLTKKMEVFDASGASIGFVPIYASIT